MTTTICFDQVRKRFGAQVALDGVSFEVPSGVVFALLGENGAGKTTAIRILLGLAEPDAGKSAVLGLDSMADGLAISRGGVSGLVDAVLAVDAPCAAGRDSGRGGGLVQRVLSRRGPGQPMGRVFLHRGAPRARGRGGLDASHPVYKYRSAGTTAVTAHEVWARGEIFAIP